jgi:hypothetical protein
MYAINQDSFLAIQPELTSGESILWAGQPNSRIILHKEDSLLIPFSLIWGGFALFWEAGSAGLLGSATHSGNRWIFGMIWGIPFVMIGQYMIWGRFVYAAWKKKRTHYAVTSHRVIVVQDGWRRQMAATYIDSLPTLIKEGGSSGPGTLRFSMTATPTYGSHRTSVTWDSMAIGAVPRFVDIDDVDTVYRLVSDLREKARTAKAL